MLNEVLEVHRDWFLHPDHGVNKLLTLVPRTAPLESVYPTPFLKTVATEIDDEQVAIGLPPQVTPGLMLTVEVGESSDDEQVQDMGDGMISLLMRYVVRASEAKVGTMWAGYSMRAVCWSWRRLYQEQVPGATAARSRHGIQFYRASALSWAPMWQPMGDVHVACTLKGTVWYRDSALALTNLE